MNPHFNNKGRRAWEGRPGLDASGPGSLSAQGEVSLLKTGLTRPGGYRHIPVSMTISSMSLMTSTNAFPCTPSTRTSGQQRPARTASEAATRQSHPSRPRSTRTVERDTCPPPYVEINDARCTTTRGIGRAPFPAAAGPTLVRHAHNRQTPARLPFATRSMRFVIHDTDRTEALRKFKLAVLVCNASFKLADKDMIALGTSTTHALVCPQTALWCPFACLLNNLPSPRMQEKKPGFPGNQGLFATAP